MKKFTTLFSVIVLSLAMTITSFAGTWKSNSVGWWYEHEDGSYYTNGWQWVDGNNDGIAECYYFDALGYCLMNTTTPDGYLVDNNGAWIIDGVVQTKLVAVHAQTQPAVSTENQYVQAEPTASETVSNTTDIVSGISAEPYDGYTIIVNTNTGKYHVPTCKSVKQMKDKNKGYCSSADYLLNLGYQPCKNCH